MSTLDKSVWIPFKLWNGDGSEIPVHDLPGKKKKKKDGLSLIEPRQLVQAHYF